MIATRAVKSAVIRTVIRHQEKNGFGACDVKSGHILPALTDANHMSATSAKLWFQSLLR